MAALTAEAPDPKTFKSWEDAFQYPVPAARRMEQQLRGDISSNRERLRTLVSTSYRDLLGTADSIVQMDGQMRQVEAHLGDISKRCNTRILDTSIANTRLVSGKGHVESRKNYAFAAQLAMLRSCPEVLSRILKRKGSVLLAAKVLVLSRLLHKKVSGHLETSAYVETLRGRLGKLRQKLLTGIDRRLASPVVDPTMLSDALCAYSLATTSSCADILQHFHRVRLEAISSQLRKLNVRNEDALHSFRLCIATLQETQAMFSRQMSNALARLKVCPLLQDSMVRSIAEFDLDVHEAWIGDDIRNFTPYVRHDDLPVASAAQQLSTWALSALSALLTGIGALIASEDDPNSIITLRRECLQLWFANRNTVVGITKTEVLDKFRETFQERLRKLILVRCASISELNSLIMRNIEQWDSLPTDANSAPPHLWSEKVIRTSLDYGAEALAKAINTSFYGKTANVNATLDRYNTWLTKIQSIEHAISTLRETKWDDLDSDSDSGSESDASDHSTHPTPQRLLSTEDPTDLTTHLTTALQSSLSSLHQTLTTASTYLLSTPALLPRAAYLLRVLRALTACLPASLPTWSPPRCIHALHLALARPLVETLVAQYRVRIRRAVSRTDVPGRELWDGEPALPVMLAPWAFAVLRELERGMGGAGPDLWTVEAVGVLKGEVREGLAREVRGAGGGVKDEGEVVDHSAAGGGADKDVASAAAADDDSESVDSGVGRHDARVQLLFDVRYLAVATSTRAVKPKSKQITEKAGENEGASNGEQVDNGLEDSKGDAGDDLTLLVRKLESEVALGNEERQRLARSVEKYWGRTSLLFGLLG